MCFEYSPLQEIGCRIDWLLFTTAIGATFSRLFPNHSFKPPIAVFLQGPVKQTLIRWVNDRRVLLACRLEQSLRNLRALSPLVRLRGWRVRGAGQWNSQAERRASAARRLPVRRVLNLWKRLFYRAYGSKCLAIRMTSRNSSFLQP